MSKSHILFSILILGLSACAQLPASPGSPASSAGKVCLDILVSVPAKERETWSPQGNYVIAHDSLSGQGKLLELSSGKLQQDKDYLAFSPDGTEVLYRKRGFSQKVELGRLNLLKQIQEPLNIELPQTIIADDHSRISWSAQDAIHIGLVTRQGENNEARIYRYNPQTKALEQTLSLTAPDPNGFDWQLIEGRFYFRDGNTLKSQAAGESSARVDYTAAENLQINLQGHQAKRLALSLAGADKAKLITLDTSNGETTEIATSRDRLDLFGPVAFSTDGKTLFYTRRRSGGWDELRGRMPFYQAEILSSPASSLQHSASEDVSRLLVLPDGRLLYSTPSKVSELDPLTGQTQTPQRCR